MSDYMPEEMLRKKQLNIELSKEKTKEANELSYVSAMKYDEMKSQASHIAALFDRTREHSDFGVSGKPSFKAKAELRARRKENIKKGEKIAPGATAFTFEIYDHIHSIDDVLSNDYIAINGVPLDQLMGQLSKVRFQNEMLYPSMIRANFKNYITLIREWERYSNMEKEDGESLPPGLLELYNIFYRQMSLYCRQNRINLDGTPMEKGEKVEEAELVTEDEEKN